MIKVLTAHSGQGGSTTAHMNLCSLFNRNGIPCEVYGPHERHLDKCPGRKIEGRSVAPRQRQPGP